MNHDKQPQTTHSTPRQPKLIAAQVLHRIGPDRPARTRIHRPEVTR